MRLAAATLITLFLGMAAHGEGDAVRDKVRLGLMRSVPPKWDLDANFATFLRLLDVASEKDVEIFITPEGWLDGYAAPDKASTPERLRGVGQDLDTSPYLKRVGEEAVKRSMWICFGFTSLEGGRIFNAAGLWDRDGRLIGVYHKTHIQTHDVQYARGEALPVWPSPWGPLGIMICADRRWPETARVLRLQGARLILNPTYGFRGDLNEAMMRTRAYENQCYVAFTHPEESLVTGPKGEVVAKEAEGEGVLVCDVDLSRAKDDNHLQDRRPELYGLLTKQSARDARWRVSAPVLLPGPKGAFDDIAVKDPSVVWFGDRWHVFYTACGENEYSIGYASAETLEALQAAPRRRLEQIRGVKESYAAAPQVFFFEPQQTWYLVCQTRDANYQPVYSTTKTIEDPATWTAPQPLVVKDEEAKWIDFWVVCDDTTAYLFYTREHQDVYAMATRIEDFPNGFGHAEPVFSPVHEAVHVYKALGRDEYHMIYELRAEDGTRRFGLATAPQLLGPWTRQTDDFATGGQLAYPEGVQPWTEEVSHGEMIRAGYGQRMEYEAAHARFLIQGMPVSAHTGPYPRLPWVLGIITKE